ncbi:ECF-type sigma factor [Pelomonas cellulosilytica]|uniref:Sigma-70 family RNA polymerase sigma factor n=1 Tax=Pelomonas cellulosilytica TaxID=2906762 RepID=A0ABS8XVL8_9BURK|nr:ECF-type sigma factor [Pelomonas sp. P8]MCE4554676.1 sigma-70 family RNA polymerase sigma factor [Pelomonas sp. P8]
MTFPAPKDDTAAPADGRPLTQLLQAWQAGDAAALQRLLGWVQAELLRLAQSRLRGQNSATLGPEDLLQESLLKLLASTPDWQDRQHFFATVSLAMRQVLVDHARRRQAGKRAGGAGWQLVDETVSGAGEEAQTADLLTLERLLQQLEAEDPRAAQVVQLTYFIGLEREEVAAVMSLSVATVDRELRHARAWLSAGLGRATIEA